MYLSAAQVWLRTMYPDAPPAFQVPPATCELVAPLLLNARMKRDPRWRIAELEREFWAFRARRLASSPPVR